jgi:excisionase family DNA binding protein
METAPKDLGPLDVWLPTHTAAEIAGLSRRRLYADIKRGRLPATKLGHRTVRVRYSDLQRYMSERPAA